MNYLAHLYLSGDVEDLVIGNFIGTDGSGTMDMGNSNHGVCIGDSSGNYIGPGETGYYRAPYPVPQLAVAPEASEATETE